jgi:curved DNA-binding protein CbpA
MAFINQNQNDQENTQATEVAPATPASPVAPISQPSAVATNPQRKGSGRFTNIQKYIGANQGAGERLASGVSQRIDAKLNPSVQKTEKNVGDVRDGILAGQKTLGAGNLLKTQVSDPNFNATQFAQNQQNVDQFTQFRTGAGLDEGALRTQAQNAQIQAQQAQQQAQQLGQQFGTEQGRQQLLKQTFSPGRNYSSGQQRLDQLFLQQATPQIQGIQSNIQTAQQKLGTLGNQFPDLSTQIQDLATNEQTLAKDLTDNITGQEKNLVDQVLSTRESVNNQRTAEQQAARDQYSRLVEGQTVDKNFLANLGLNENQSVYNVLRDQGNIDDYIKFNNTLLTSADQLANQDQRAKYDAIARLAGIDPNNRNIKNNTVVDSALNFQDTLKKRVGQADTDFRKMIQDAKVFGAPSAAQLDQIHREAFNSAPTVQYGGEQASRGIDRSQHDSNQFFGRSLTANFARDAASKERAEANLGNIVGAIEQLDPKALRQDNQQLISTINNTAMGTQQAQTGNKYADQARDMARAQIQQDVLKRLADAGYFNRVATEDDTLESGGNFDVK